MERKASRAPAACILLALCLVFTACGGSSSNGGNQNPSPPLNLNRLLAGTYLVHQIANSTTPRIYTAQVEVSAAGDGTGSFTIRRHSVTGTTGGGPFTYTVAADHSLTISNGPGTDTGVVSGDGSFFVVTDAETTSADTDGETVLALGMRLGDCKGLNLAGRTYIAGQIGQTQLPTQPPTESLTTKRIQITVTSATMGSFTLLGDSLGSIGATGDFDYSVAGDCTLSVDNGMGIDFGIVSEDGSRILLVDADHNDNDSEIILFLGLEQSTNAGPSLFQGAYRLGEAGANNNVFGPSDFYTAILEADADGKGAVTLTELADSQATNPGPPSQLTYSVNTDGTGQLVDGSVSIETMIDPAGELSFAVDTDPSDGEISLTVGLLH